MLNKMSFEEIYVASFFPSTETVNSPVSPVVATEAPKPATKRRVFAEERQYGMSKKQESFANELAREIRDRLFNQFKENTSANYWQKNFSIDNLIEIRDELRAGRNFNVK